MCIYMYHSFDACYAYIYIYTYIHIYICITALMLVMYLSLGDFLNSSESQCLCC